MSDQQRRPTVTITVGSELKAKIRDRADERSMSMSTYVRVMMLAGEKQVLALEDEIEGNGDVALEEKVLNAVPSDSDDARSHEEISEEVLNKVEQQVFELLDSDDRITHSAARGGYYIE